VHLALFESAGQACRSTVAFAAGAAEFLAWRAHLEGALGRPAELEDHQVAWSLYFKDPDGNPFEITSYEHVELAAVLRRAGDSAPPAG
jgi:catechol 2,3-dioxygenase-like lactoylglutathione lyase family enzyme